MEDIRGVRLRKFNLRKIILGVRMPFHHIFPGQDKAVPSFGEAVEEWKPPDKIYTIDNTINTILHYMLGFFSFFLFFNIPSFHLSFSPLYSLFFNPSCFLIIFFLLIFLKFFSYIIFSSFLIIIKLKNTVYILIQLIVQCGYIKPLKSMQLIRQFNNAIQLITQLSNTT